MNRRHFSLFALVLVLTVPGFAIDKKTDKPTTTASDKALEKLMTKGWPTDKISNTVPVYTDGTVINSGGDSQTYYIKVDQTSKAGLTAYLETLKKAGWIVNADANFPEATKGLVKLGFNMEGTVGLQITVSQAAAGEWPTDIPQQLVAPVGAKFGEKISVQTTEPDRMWYFTFKCLGMNEAAARTWMNGLVKQGWSGDDEQLSRRFTWKGKPIHASLEIYETNDDATTFTYNFNVDD